MKESKSRNSVTEGALIQYERYLKDGEKSRATVEKYLRDVRKFWDCLGEWGVQELGKEQVLEYKRYLSEHYRTTSADSMLAAVNSFLEYLGYEGYKVKLFKIQCIQFYEPERELTEKEYGRLMQATEREDDSRMSMLPQTIRSTGIRVSELRFITVKSLERGRAEIYNKGESRVALLPAELMKVLKKYCRKMGITGGSIFITRNERPMNRSNVNKETKKLGRGAGVDEREVFPHSFRHLFVRTFYRVEEDVVRLMDLLGHSNINTIRICTVGTESQPRRQLSRMKLMSGQP